MEEDIHALAWGLATIADAYEKSSCPKMRKVLLTAAAQLVTPAQQPAAVAAPVLKFNGKPVTER